MPQHGSSYGLFITRMMGRPVMVAIAIAVAGVLGMLLVDHGPWTGARVQSAQVAYYETTGEAARAVGATVTPTEPKHIVEPAVPGPKPVDPPAPFTQ
jgi:hypothetical protein